MPDFNPDDYIGRTQKDTDTVVQPPLDLMSAILDSDWKSISPEGTLPPLWHWMMFFRPVPQSQIGPDGHPKRGPFLPPITLPRRMFAGSRSEYHAPLKVGDAVERVSTIADIKEKTGRSGTLMFVTVRYEITGPKGLAITEEQDLVYRDAPPPGAPGPVVAPEPASAPEGYESVDKVSPDPVLLFRFSAATNNSHRIHYDYPYVTDEEGYPALVVHGPLLAVLLADKYRAMRPGQAMKRFSFRAKKPVFVGSSFHRCFKSEGGGAKVHIVDGAGDVCMEAEAE